MGQAKGGSDKKLIGKGGKKKVALTAICPQQQWLRIAVAATVADESDLAACILLLRG